MPEISEQSSLEDVAAIVSDALDAAGIVATLSGGSSAAGSGALPRMKSAQRSPICSRSLVVMPGAGTRTAFLRRRFGHHFRGKLGL